MIDSNYFILNVILLTIGTILIRISFIAFSGKMKISAKIKDLFTYIPAAILPGLFIPATYYYQGSVGWLNNHERFFIILASLFVTYFIRNTLFCIVLGLGMLYLAIQFS